MVKPGQLKYPFALRTLEERLELEKKWQVNFRIERERGEEPLRKEWADKNISSGEYRINELILSIKELKSFIYTKEECDEINKTNKEDS